MFRSGTSQADVMKWAIVCGLFPLLLAAQAAGGDWPNYRGPDRDGISTETPVWPADITANEIWRASLGEGFSQVAVSGGRVYTMGWVPNQDTVYCFDEASTGNDPAPIWDESYACGSHGTYTGTYATPTVDGNEVYTFSHDGLLSCFDKDDGTPRWNKSTGFTMPGYGFASSPLVEGNKIIVNAGTAGAAIDMNAPHDVLWGTNGSASHASPVAFEWSGQRTVAIFTHTRVVGVDPANGDERWQFPWPSDPTHAADPIPFPSDNKIWIASGYDNGCAVLNLGTGTLTADWSDTTEMRNRMNCSVLWNGYVYGIDESAGLSCVEFSTGTRQWEMTGFGEQGSVMLANAGAALPEDAELIAMSNSGDLVIAKAWPNQYTELHRWNDILAPDTWTCPVLANGKLYVRNHPGLLVCYDVSGGTGGTQVTIGTTPAGRTFTVDTVDHSSQQTFNWQPATTHNLSVATTQSGGTGVRYVFTGWSDGPVSASRTYTTPDTADSFTADFKTQYRLTTATTGTGTGSVSPASGTWYDSGTVVSVSATPGGSDAFIEWTGDLSGRTSPQNLTMNGAKSVTAHFALLTDDTDSDGLTNAEELAEGTYMNDSDSDDDGLPDGWEVQYLLDPLSASGDDGASGDPDSDTYTNLQEYQGNSDPRNGSSVPQYPITTATTGTGTGSVSPASGTPYDPGTVVSVSATPNASSAFIEWSGALSGRINPQNLTVDGPKSVTARFDLLTDDSDSDGLTNAEELAEGTYLNDSDSDDDDLPDGWEVDNDLDALSPAGPDGAGGDPDGDTYTNLQEYQGGSDPRDETSVPTTIGFRGTGCAAGTAGAGAALMLAALALLASKTGRRKATAQRP